jgi:hypothetical protein
MSEIGIFRQLSKFRAALEKPQVAATAWGKPTGGLQIVAAKRIFSVGWAAVGKFWSSFGQEE